MDWAEIIGVLVSFIGLMVYGVKLLLSDWFKKSNELEDLKKKNSDKIQTRLEEDLKTLRQIVDVMKDTIKTVNMKLDRSDIRATELSKKLDETIKMIDLFEQRYSEKLKNMIKTEIVELTKNASLIRSKKI